MKAVGNEHHTLCRVLQGEEADEAHPPQKRG